MGFSSIKDMDEGRGEMRMEGGWKWIEDGEMRLKWVEMC